MVCIILYNINVKELFAIVAAPGVLLDGINRFYFIQICSLVITHVWRSSTSSDRMITRLVRYLFLFTTHLNINVLMQHIPGHMQLLLFCLTYSLLSLIKSIQLPIHIHHCWLKKFVDLATDIQHFQAAALAECTSSTFATALGSYLFCQQIRPNPRDRTTVLLFSIGSVGGTPHHQSILVGHEGLSCVNMWCGTITFGYMKHTRTIF